MLESVGGLLAEAADAVRAHHERWDGTGYPARLVGEEIPICARIVAVCDAYSAITTNRPYRSARSSGEALAEITAGAGSQFDPRVAAALTRLIVTASRGDLRAAA